MMRVCCLFSGGKDSAYALHRMLLSGMEVPILLVIEPTDPDSFLYHSPGLEAAPYFSGLTGIRVENRSMGEEGDVGGLSSVLSELKAEHHLDAVCAGALLSDYQRMRFSQAAFEAGLIAYTPVWRKDGGRYMEELLRDGFSFMLVSYSSPGFSPSDLGCEVDKRMLERFRSICRRWGSHPAFEGGEAETLVLGAPLFPRRLKVRGSAVQTGENNARFVIEGAELL